MTFRSRMRGALLLATLLPVAALALVVRGEMTKRVTDQYVRRVDAVVSGIAGDLDREGERISMALIAVGVAMKDDNRFRRAAVDKSADDRRYLIDYAGAAMRITGLAMLQIQDESGRILSSGHFRNEFDRLEPELPRGLASLGGTNALVRAREPDGAFAVLARIDSVNIGNRRFAIVGGVRADHVLDRLTRDADVLVTLVVPPDTAAVGAPGSAKTVVRNFGVAYIDTDSDSTTMAMFRVTHDLVGLRALRSGVDRWFAIAAVIAALLAILLSEAMASRISRPIVDLAARTARVDLEALDVEFNTDRDDEVGVLSRGLAAMAERLRTSARLIRDTERRAALGEIARQVNHDIRNGLTPIRNVIRHLSQLQGDDAAQLPAVFAERRDTLESSISYLDNLAHQYARLSSAGERRACDVNAIVRRVVSDRQGARVGAEVRANLAPSVFVHGDPVSLRRVVENLVGNAIESLGPEGGTVTVTTGRATMDAGDARVHIVVEDTGVGMSAAERVRIFDDFFTTKETGTGLGLSIVRRLVMDMDGTVGAESEPGKGSRFTVDLPATTPDGDENGANTGR